MSRGGKHRVVSLRDVADGLSAKYYPNRDDSHGLTLRGFKGSGTGGYITECCKLPSRDVGDVFLGAYEWGMPHGPKEFATNWQGFILIRTQHKNTQHLDLGYSSVLHFLRVRPDYIISRFGESGLDIIYRRKWHIEIRQNEFLIHRPNRWLFHSDFTNVIEDAVTVCEAYRSPEAGTA